MLIKANEDRVIAFKGYKEVILRSGFIAKVEKFFEQYTERSLKGGLSSAEIHRTNLRIYQSRWRGITSNNTCLLCLRRRPQYELHCGHEICENCVVVFGKRSSDDPWLFEIDECLLCGAAMIVESPELQLKMECGLETETEEYGPLIIRIHPPTAGVGVLCVDGGGVRATAPLGFLERLQRDVALPIPVQRFFKVAVGISSGRLPLFDYFRRLTSTGGLIVADLFINGHSIERSTKRFEGLVGRVFQRRNVLTSPYVPRFLKLLISYLADSGYPISLVLQVLEFLVSYFADGLYPSENIEATLKQAFGVARGILDASQATRTGTRVGLPVATVDDKPSCKIFTNYNGVGERNEGNGKSALKTTNKGLTCRDHVIKPRDDLGKVLLWEV